MWWVEWLDKNKEWVFSGVGVTTITILIGGATWLLKRRQSRNQIATQAPAKSDDAATFPLARVAAVTADDIQKAMEGAPPLGRNEVLSRYVGIAVEWDTKLVHADKDVLGTVRLSLKPHQWFMVKCRVKIKDYPELSILPRDSSIRIRGVIEHVDPLIIDIRDVLLIQLKPPHSGIANG